jgi:transcriptional regulator with XRE-family HTH domain
MILDDYLKESGEKPVAFAVRSELSQPYVSRLLRGDRYPGPDVIEKIKLATGGKVTAEDWLTKRARVAAERSAPPEAEAAA